MQEIFSRLNMKWLAPVQKAFEVPRGVMIFPFRRLIGSRSALASPFEILLMLAGNQF